MEIDHVLGGRGVSRAGGENEFTTEITEINCFLISVCSASFVVENPLLLCDL